MTFSLIHNISFRRVASLQAQTQAISKTNPVSVLISRGKKRMALQVKLLENIDGLGEIGEVVQVKRGRMRNDLYPKKLAQYVLRETRQVNSSQIGSSNTAQQSLLQDVLGKKSTSNKSALTSYLRLAKLHKDLRKLPVLNFIRSTVGEATADSSIYGSVSVEDVANELRTAHDLIVDKETIRLEKIKQLGQYQAVVELGTIGSRTINISVVAPSN